jgi:hypothetical protein
MPGKRRFARGFGITTRRAPYTQWIEILQDRRLFSASTILVEPNLTASPLVTSTVPYGYTPSQIKAAYGFSSSSTAGAGETIAIVDAYNDPNIASDLAAFDKQFGLSAPASLKIASETGSTTQLPSTNASWDMEIALDVEWAHAIAPGASLLLVEANSASLNDLLTAVNYAKTVSNVATISMSWGSSEFRGESAYDSVFTTPAGHQGITFVAASGDEGSRYGPEWPATSSNVLAVGGTTLSLNSSGAYSSETTWNGSTGGVSAYESEPTYQRAVESTGRRTTPDVAYDANPNSGFAVYDSVPQGGTSGWYEVGGTSAGAPQWAALIATADAARGASLDGATQTIPALYSIFASSSTYAQDFNDVVSGSSSGLYSAGKGYDLVTGLGTPKAAAMIAALGRISATALATTTTSASAASRAAVISSVLSGTTSGFAGMAYHGFDAPVDAIHWANQSDVVVTASRAFVQDDSARVGIDASAAPLPAPTAFAQQGLGGQTLSSIGSLSDLIPLTLSEDPQQAAGIYPLGVIAAADLSAGSIGTAGQAPLAAGDEQGESASRSTERVGAIASTPVSVATATLTARPISTTQAAIAVAAGVVISALMIKPRQRRSDQVVAGFIYSLGD